MRQPVPRIGFLAALASILLAPGCAAYIALPEDPPEVRSSKTRKRVAVSIVTLGFAEIAFGKKSRRIRAQRRAYRAGVEFTRALMNAQTLPALIHLMGDAPECFDSGELRTCYWENDTRTYVMRGRTHGASFYGYFTAFSTLRAIQTGGHLFKVICTLPVDGRVREPRSCSHSTRDGLQPEGYLLTCMGKQIFCPPDWRDNLEPVEHEGEWPGPLPRPDDLPL